MRHGDISLIVSRLSDAPARKFHVSRRFFVLGGAAAVIVVASTVLSALHYYHMWTKTQDHASLKTEVMDLRKENDRFRLIAKQLTDRVSSMEVSTQKLRILSGDEDGLGGVGGPSAGNDAVLGLDETSLYNHFRSLDRRSMSMKDELQKLQDYYKDRGLLLAATPALMPVRGYPSDRFGYRRDPFTGVRDFHPGIDISAPKGNKVIATADGVIQFAGRQVGYGRVVKITHRFGVSTRYGHLSQIAVKKGQEVRKGDVIGYVGSTGRATGSHVHYEVRLNGRPLDPARFFREVE